MIFKCSFPFSRTIKNVIRTLTHSDMKYSLKVLDSKFSDTRLSWELFYSGLKLLPAEGKTNLAPKCSGLFENNVIR